MGRQDGKGKIRRQGADRMARGRQEGGGRIEGREKTRKQGADRMAGGR